MLTASTAAIAAYCRALLDAFAPDTSPGAVLANWLRYRQRLVGIDYAAATAPTRTRKRRKPAKEKPLTKAQWQRLGRALDAVATGPTAPDSVAANLGVFAETLGLDAIEDALFRFVFHTGREPELGTLSSSIVFTRAVDSLGLASLALRRPAAELEQRLKHGPIRALDLIAFNGEGKDRFGCCVPERFLEALRPPNNGLADIERCLIGAPLRPLLAGADFAHVARERDFVLRLLRGAVEGRRSGINILLYGPPGTGKSEFCKTVAAEAGCDLFAVGETDELGDEPTRRDRINALRLAEKLAARRRNAVLLFDEMEDVGDHGDGWLGSKVFFNRVLERNRVPVLWTTNRIDGFDPACLRRMSFAFELKAPPATARARLWAGFAERQALPLPADQALALARRHKVAPSVMSSAVDAVAMARGDSGDIDFVVAALARPIGGARPHAPRTAIAFSSELANTDTDLASLARALARPGAARDISLCLYGPPGTGKSGFARHLAEAMGLDPLLKRGSDLLSCWVGGTEEKIAAAFEEARAEQRLLIVDEVEAFLWHRSGASRSWEVSMVNEFLTALEEHSLPFAGTTNALDAIDPAALRRFDFKVKFDFLTPAQAGAAYRRFFARPAPAGLADIPSLTPGDFAVVARQLRLLGDVGDGDILRLLAQEVRAKNLPASRIGF
jgi:AAA+ superfamily predicted ATPase